MKAMIGPTSLTGLPLALLLILFSTICVSLAAQDGTDTERSVVAGIVTNSATTLAMAEVPVTLTATHGTEYGAITDGTGAFVVELPAGTYVIDAPLEGYYRLKGSGPVNVTLGPGQELRDLILRIAPGLTISGSVVDADGAPLNGAMVMAVESEYDSTGQFSVRPCYRSTARGSKAVTDENGEFRLFGFRPGEYYVATAPTGCGFNPRLHYYPGVDSPSNAPPIVLSNGVSATGIRIPVKEEGSFSVRFRIQEPFAISRIGQIMLLQQANGVRTTSETLLFGALPNIFRQEDDEWIGEGFAPGTYTLYVTSDIASLEVGTLTFTIVDDDVDAGTLVMREAVEITGRVRPPEARALDRDELLLRLVPVEGPGGPGGALVAGVQADGSFVVNRVTMTGAAARGYAPAGRYEVEVVVRRIGRRPLPLPSDLYVASVASSGHDALFSGLVVDGTGPLALEIVLASPGGVVDGTVRNGSDEPVGDARVVLIPSADRQGNSTLFRTAFTDQFGQFAFHGVMPGDYQVLAWETIIDNAWLNPDFRRPFATRAELIQVFGGSRDTLELEAIPDGQ